MGTVSATVASEKLGGEPQHNRRANEPTDKLMPTEIPGDPALPLRPAVIGGPIITATERQLVVTGSGFLSNHSVTIRITHAGDEIADYLTYTTDADGCLTAPLPLTAIVGTAQISASDHRLNPLSDDGLLWSNALTVTAAAT